MMFRAEVFTYSGPYMARDNADAGNFETEADARTWADDRRATWSEGRWSEVGHGDASSEAWWIKYWIYANDARTAYGSVWMYGPNTADPFGLGAL